MSEPRAIDAGAPRPSVFANEQAVIWVLWLTYGAFYFCRTNISAAVPGLRASESEGGLGLSGSQVGLILGALKISYGVGQAINGQLAERFSPRVMLALGMFVSAALNVLFGFGTSFYFLLFVWACNGFFQSMGWTPCMRVAADWIPILKRGRAIGVIGTGYQVTAGLTFLIAGWSAQELGWRGAHLVPAALLTLTGLFMLLCLEESPPNLATQPDRVDDAAQPTVRSESVQEVNGMDARNAAPPGSRPSSAIQERVTESSAKGGPDASDYPTIALTRGTFVENILQTLSNPALWLLGLSLGLLNACRYGFLDWGLAHLRDMQQIGVGRAALSYAVLPLGAVAGVYLAGWATDRFFGGRRAPVVVVLMLLLAVLTLFYHEAVQHGSTFVVLLLLVVIGFCIFGPQVLLVGTAPADLARRGTAAAAAGFVNFMGYMGATAGDIVTGQMLDSWGWQTAIYVWAGWALGSALTAAVLWNAVGHARARGN